MKVLINKHNPAIRITAPKIEFYREFYTLSDKDSHYLFKMEDWTLVEEEQPEKQTSKYFKKPDYDKQVVKKMSKELAKIITDQIVELVDLEKLALEKYPIQVAYLEGLKKGYELGLNTRNDEQEKQEVDLEKEAVAFCFDNGINATPNQATRFARHFYELGKNSK